MTRITNPQTLRVYDFIRSSILTHHFSPTVREIGAAVFLSHSSVMPHLSYLEARGWIEREPYKARSIRLGDLGPDYES